MDGMGRVELWGFVSDDLDAVRADLETRLPVEFELIESESIGPYFFAELAGEATLTLRPNLSEDFDEATDDPDEAYAESDYPDFGTVLYIEWIGPARDLTADLGPDAQLLDVE